MIENSEQRGRNAGPLLATLAGAAPVVVLIANVPRAAGGGSAVALVTMFLAATVAAMVCAYCVASAQSFMSSNGDINAFIDHSLGPVIGRSAAIITALGALCVQVSLAGALAYIAHDSARSLWGWNVPWPIVAIISLTAAATIEHRRISFGRKFLACIVYGQLALLVVMDVAILIQNADKDFVTGNQLVVGDGLNRALLNPVNALESPAAAALAAVLAVLLALFSWTGNAFSPDFSRRSRTRASPLLALLALGLMYAVTVWLVTSSWGTQRTIVDAGTLGPSYFLVPATTYVGAFTTNMLRLFAMLGAFLGIVAFHGLSTHAWSSIGPPKPANKRINVAHACAAVAFTSLYTVGARSKFSPDFAGIYLQPAILAGVLLLVRMAITSVAISRTKGSRRGLATLSLISSIGLILVFVAGTRTAGVTRLTQNLWVVGLAIAGTVVIASRRMHRFTPQQPKIAPQPPG